MWGTSETKEQSRIRPRRLSTVRRGSSKEYDQGWDAASKGIPYEKAPYDRTTNQGKEWRMGHNHFRQYGSVGRLSTVRRGSSKEYDQGWDAASQEVPYKKDPNDRSPGRLKALTGVGKGRDADYDAGWDTAIAGKAYTNNPHKKGTAEYARWACGHNHAGIYGGAKTNES